MCQHYLMSTIPSVPPNAPPVRHVRSAGRFLARRAHLIALALFAAVGFAVLTDYGVAIDEATHREVGYASLDYILGDADDLIQNHSDRYYGVVFQVSLVAVERLLGMEDPREIYLSRHLLTHLFFIASGFFAWLLAHRLFGSRLVALLAMLIYLLHPRIYAHSHFNSQDLPFLSMFMVALYLAHRAFRRDAVWAFAVCGAGAGMLTCFRILGVALFPVILGALALDALCAARREGWRGDGAKRAGAKTLTFTAAFAATVYAAWPLLWRDPTEIIDAFRVMASHPTTVPTLFRGELVRWPNIPWDYVPTWMLITTPPIALSLAALGTARIARLCAVRWRDMFANSTARFGLMMVACLILPIAAVIALNSNIYHNWRHMYFLYAPLCVLAAFGLAALAAIPRPRLRAGAFALAAVGIAAALAQMVNLHPYQNDYFNPLANKNGIADRWQMSYWDLSHKEALEALLEIQPTGRIDVTDPADQFSVERNMRVIPKDDRRRLSRSLNFPTYRIISGDAGDAAIWQREIYGVVLASIVDVRAESEAAFGDAYAAARASERVAGGGGYDMRLDGDALAYLNDDCGDEAARGTFSLYIYPSHRSDLSEDALANSRAYESSGFDLWRYGGMFGGKCLIPLRLPGYPIHMIETWQTADGGESALWKAAIPLAESLDDYAAALSAASESAPAASAGGFDIYMDGGGLIYVKRRCAQDDARGRFFLSVFPADRADLSAEALDAGREHEALNFEFHQYGAALGGDCVIVRYLPEYPISRVETGQWIPGGGGLWSARIDADGG